MPSLHATARRIPPMILNLLKLAGVAALLVAGLFACVKLAGLVAPFIVALLMASVMEPLVRAMNERLRLSRTLSVFVALVLVLALVAVALGLVSGKIVREARDLVVNLPGMYESAIAFLEKMLTDLDARFEFIDGKFLTMVEQALSASSGQVMAWVNSLTRGVWSTATSLPHAIVVLIVIILGTFFLSRDRKKVVLEVHKQLPEGWIRRICAVKDDLFGALFGYVRALLLLMLLTFVELAIGFSLVGIDYAILFALIISMLDALPVLGTGTFVVPWAAYNLLIGDLHTGIGLLLVFAVVWTVRQLLEPHVVGDQIGIHPLLTLFAMYLGMRFMGVFGMILGPVTLIVVRNLLRVYSGGRTLREMLYQGVEMPEEELQKSEELARLAQEAPKVTAIDRLLARATDWFKRRFSKK
ncbi:MAG: sporulation integral membrane protein YtvI [Clostridia bacterium]